MKARLRPTRRRAPKLNKGGYDLGVSLSTTRKPPSLIGCANFQRDLYGKLSCPGGAAPPGIMMCRRSLTDGGLTPTCVTRRLVFLASSSWAEPLSLSTTRKPPSPLAPQSANIYRGSLLTPGPTDTYVSAAADSGARLPRTGDANQSLENFPKNYLVVIKYGKRW